VARSICDSLPPKRFTLRHWTNFELSPDQPALRDAVARICSQLADDYWLAKDKEGGFPFELHRGLAASGWLGICIPEDYGGAGLGIAEAALMMQTISESGASATTTCSTARRSGSRPRRSPRRC
jgi:alkylation response protein AidB-like acyl-CoA dehydrogenase